MLLYAELASKMANNFSVFNFRVKQYRYISIMYTKGVMHTDFVYTCHDQNAMRLRVEN